MASLRCATSVISLIEQLVRVTWRLTSPVCSLSLQIYNEKKSQFQIKRNNPRDLVERVAQDISNLLHKKGKALGVRRQAARSRRHTHANGTRAAHSVRVGAA